MPEQVTGDGSPPLSARLADASNVLLLAPSFQDGVDAACTQLHAGEKPADARVLAVTYTRSPHEWVADWLDSVGTMPADGLLVSVGDGGRTDGADPGGDVWTVERISNAGNLTRLGITLSDYLADGGRGRTRLCFDSLTVLLQYASLERAFKFLHAITSRVRSANAVGHYHLDPAAHDEQTLATIKGLFDAVVEVDESGDHTVTTR